MNQKIKDIINLEGPLYQHKYWNSTTVRRYCVIDIAIRLSKVCKLICYLDHGFMIDYKNDAYSIKVLDSWNVLIESYGKLKTMSIDNIIDIIDGKANKELIDEFVA